MTFNTVSKRYQGTGILKSDCKQPQRIGIIRALNECTGRLFRAATRQNHKSSDMQSKTLRKRCKVLFRLNAVLHVLESLSARNKIKANFRCHYSYVCSLGNVNFPHHMGISDCTRTVQTVCVYTYTVRPYAYVLTPLISICRSCCLHLQMLMFIV